MNIFIILFSLTAHAHDCGGQLRDGDYKAILKQIETLNPNILNGADPSVAQIYLRLKNESETYERQDIEPELAQRLRETQKSHFRIENLDSRALTIFYRNAVYLLEQRAASLWRRQEVRSLAGRPLAPPLQNFAEHLLDTFFSPNGLHDHALSSREAAGYFKARPWMKFAWNEAIQAVEDWLKTEKPSREIELPDIFDWNEQNRIRLALAQDKRTGACCLSEPGCTLCPHNRGLLKR